MLVKQDKRGNGKKRRCYWNMPSGEGDQEERDTGRKKRVKPENTAFRNRIPDYS